MEKLTPSASVLNIYGFCAQAALNELAETTLKDVVKTSSKKRKNSQGGKVISRLSSLQKLNFAAQIAQGVADLHTIDGGNNVTAVWRDIKPANILVMKDGSVKINDFNAAELLYWNTRKNTQCTFRRILLTPNVSHQWDVCECPVHTRYSTTHLILFPCLKMISLCSFLGLIWLLCNQYKSPEEIKEGPLTEKVDVWSLGAIIYYILVEKEPYHSMHKADVAKAIWLGKRPEISTKLINSADKSVRTLINAMYSCFTYKEKERPTARSIVNILRSELKS